MTTNNYIFVAVMIVIMFVFHNFVKYRIKKYQQREQYFISEGHDVNAIILSMRQIGIFFNNNPVVEMKLRIEDVITNKTWLVEAHKETIMLITIDAWQVGNKYQAKTDEEEKKIVFVRDGNDRPLLSQ